MMLRLLLVCAIASPSLVNAEIYKWKDSDGKVRYSDVPPPSNIKQESLYGKKIPKPTGLAPLAPVDGDINAQINHNATTGKEKVATENATGKNKSDKEPLSKEEAAAKRAKDAEQQKKTDEAKQAESKLKQENCKAAKSNLATYGNGGRIAKTNEKGEREYMGNSDISQAKLDAQKDVEKYCD